MTGWFRSNAVALGVLVVLVPATTLAIGWNEWSGGGYASLPRTVEAGDAIAYGGATVGPATAEFTHAPLAPDAARVVSVHVPIDPDRLGYQCAIPLLREVGGAQRQWNATSGYDLDPDHDSDLREICDSERAAPYTLDVSYVVPRDASGPFTVEVVSGTSEVARLIVEP
jgi:hypothetical protein